MQSIDVVENQALEARFQAKQADFKRRNNPDDYILAFHGTSKQNIGQILRGNFRLDQVRRTVYKFRKYFSEQPEVSTGYIGGCNSLLLCRVLIGRPGLNCKVSTWHINSFRFEKPILYVLSRRFSLSVAVYQSQEETAHLFCTPFI